MAPEDGRRLSAALRECADQLSAGTSARAPLRALQQVAHTIVESAADSSVRTVAFVIDEWVNDFYLNFAGDIVFEWQRVEEVRETFLRNQAAAALSELSRALKGAPSDVLTALEVLVVSYLDAVRQANHVVTDAQ